MTTLKDLVTKNTDIFEFERDGRKFLFIGESHGGNKTDISKHLEIDEKTLTIVEAHTNINNMPIKKIHSFYNKKIKDNKQKNDDSYIDNHLLHFSKKYKTILNGNKSLKEISHRRKIKVLAIDKRTLEDYPEKTPKFLIKTEGKEKYDKIMAEMVLLKKDINKMEESSIKKKLLLEIDDTINVKLHPKNGNSDNTMKRVSEIILDFEILKHITKGKDKKVIGIVGRNHIKNIKKYLKE